MEGLGLQYFGLALRAGPDAPRARKIPRWRWWSFAGVCSKEPLAQRCIPRGRGRKPILSATPSTNKSQQKIEINMSSGKSEKAIEELKIPPKGYAM